MPGNKIPTHVPRNFDFNDLSDIKGREEPVEGIHIPLLCLQINKL
jgi:hypothetical protein